MNQIIYHMIFSFLSSVTFGVICNVPKKSLPIGGLVGMIGWMGFWLQIQNQTGILQASFVCSLLLALAGHTAARILKIPLTIFYVPGLVPIVPGITSYKAIRSLLLDRYEESLFMLKDVAFVAIGIACGLVVADILVRFFLFMWNEAKKREKS